MSTGRCWGGRIFLLMPFVLAVTALPSLALGAEVVPPTVQMPGTQPGEVTGFQAVSFCDNCHANYDPTAEPVHLWNGSMMAHAMRDPIFLATLHPM